MFAKLSTKEILAPEVIPSARLNLPLQTFDLCEDPPRLLPRYIEDRKMGHHNRHFAGDRHALQGAWSPPDSTAK